MHTKTKLECHSSTSYEEIINFLNNNLNKKAEIHSDSGSNYYREFEEGIRNKTIWIPSNSILEAYPLENIK